MNDKSNDPELSPREAEDVKKHTALRAAVVHEAIKVEGEAELRRPAIALAWSALAAGLSMGFSLMAEGLLQAHLPPVPWRPLVSKLGYSVGFLVVVLGRQQLFTENTLTVTLPLLRRRNWATLLRVLRLWIVVLGANLIGAFLFAWVIAQTGIFKPDVKQAFFAIGNEAISGSPSLIFLRGIFAGWLIALMVWLLPAAEHGRVPVIIIMTYLVALGGFPHIIAGSIDMFYTIASGVTSWGRYLYHYMVPTLLGNMLGGVSLVAMLNHAQVESETPRG